MLVFKESNPSPLTPKTPTDTRYRSRSSTINEKNRACISTFMLQQITSCTYFCVTMEHLDLHIWCESAGSRWVSTGATDNHRYIMQGYGHVAPNPHGVKVIIMSHVFFDARTVTILVNLIELFQYSTYYPHHAAPLHISMGGMLIMES